jgi:transposase
VLDHRRFWDAMHAVRPGELEEISRRIAVRMATGHERDISSVALDMTSFATFIGTGNEKAPVAQRGKARQKRSDLRIVGLGLVVTRDGGIPLTWHAYPGDRPDVTLFPAMIGQLAGQYEAIAAAAGRAAGGDGADMTVVFGAGQNSEDNFACLAGTGLRYVGSVPASACPDLTALPASSRTVVDEGRFGALTACDTRREVYGTGRRAILSHSPELHESQARGFDGLHGAGAEAVADPLQPGRVLAGGEPVGQLGEADPGGQRLAPGPLVPVHPDLDRIGEVGADLDEPRPRSRLPQERCCTSSEPVPAIPHAADNGHWLR